MNKAQAASGRAQMWRLDRSVRKLEGLKIGDRVLVMVRGSFKGSAEHVVEGFRPVGTPAVELKRPDGG